MPTCHQLQGPEKSPAVQCSRCEPDTSPMGCFYCWQHQWDTGWLPTQLGAGFTAELVLLEDQMFPWSSLEEDEVEQETQSG